MKSTAEHNSLKIDIIQLSPEGEVIVVDIYRDAKRRVIYPALFTDLDIFNNCFMRQRAYVEILSTFMIYQRNDVEP